MNDHYYLKHKCLLAAGSLAIAVISHLNVRGADLPTAAAAEITVDASQTGAPISKYIYGQFIEHLGRCVYGGLWAEMLEDRKFYFPVPASGDIWTDRKSVV
jgi:alpha-L-arabinofuranosidase